MIYDDNYSLWEYLNVFMSIIGTEEERKWKFQHRLRVTKGRKSQRKWEKVESSIQVEAFGLNRTVAHQLNLEGRCKGRLNVGINTLLERSMRNCGKLYLTLMYLSKQEGCIRQCLSNFIFIPNEK